MFIYNFNEEWKYMICTFKKIYISNNKTKLFIPTIN